MSVPIIQVENLGKRYRIGHQTDRRRYVALRDVLADTTKSVARRLWSFVTGWSSGSSASARSEEDFWALRNVSFDVGQGEVVGVVGRNGAGKSTLLKILSRITEPTEGRIRIRGRVASLLEVGTGFHPELTGRENIFLNGAILGMTRVEIRKKFDEIVAFAEIEKFLDTPVKRYSSGMYVRLAFAVAAHLEPEILLVDEVLAVGDAEFQKKCLGKMEAVTRSEHRTILFVSHNMAAIESLCTKAIYLESGSIKAEGKVQVLVSRYLSDVRIRAGQRITAPVPLGSALRLTDLNASPNPVRNGSPLEFSLEVQAETRAHISDASIMIYSAQGVRVAILDLRSCGLPITLKPGESCRLSGEVKSLPLVEGDYRIGVYASVEDFARDKFDLVTLTVVASDKPNGRVPYPAMYRGLIELESAGLCSRVKPAGASLSARAEHEVENK